MVHRRVIFITMAGIAGMVVLVTTPFVLSSIDSIKADSSIIKANNTGLITKDTAVGIALNETTMAEQNAIRQILADRYYMDENGRVFAINPETMEMTSANGDMWLTSKQLTSLDRATCFWLILLDMEFDSSYVVIVDASNGDVKDKSGFGA